jgi:hypothetical protein
MKWYRVHAHKYVFGVGQTPRFTIVKWDEGEKRWSLSGEEIIGRRDFRTLKAAKEFAAVVMQKAQEKWEAENGKAEGGAS